MRSTSCFLLMLISFIAVRAQDYIKTTDDLVLEVKILEVGLNSIKYLQTSDSTIHFIANKEVESFKYGMGKQDGTTTSIVEGTVKEKLPMYNKGVRDAEYYYVGYKPGASGTFWATLIAGPGPGLIPAFIISSRPPEENKLGCPDSVLIKDPDYYKGYMAHAKEKKVQRVWRSYIGGVIAEVVILTFLIIL